MITYLFVTLLREIRDGFMADMWRESGETFNAGVFAKTEMLISITILVLIAAMVAIKNNMKAFVLAQVIMLGGFLLSGLVTWFYLQGRLTTFQWMTAVGLGLYMTYIPYNSILFDRLLATFRYAGNVGFLIYVADSFGYLASVGVLLSKTIFKLQVNWLQFYTMLVLTTSAAGIIFIGAGMIYFKRKHDKLTALNTPVAVPAAVNS